MVATSLNKINVIESSRKTNEHQSNSRTNSTSINSTSISKKKIENIVTSSNNDDKNYNPTLDKNIVTTIKSPTNSTSEKFDSNNKYNVQVQHTNASSMNSVASSNSLDFKCKSLC